MKNIKLVGRKNIMNNLSNDEVSWLEWVYVAFFIFIYCDAFI